MNRTIRAAGSFRASLYVVPALLSLALAACAADADPKGESGGDAFQSPEPKAERSGGVIQSSDPGEVVIDNEELLNPVARVDFPGEGSVRFYEPEPGHILIGEGGLGARRFLGPDTAEMSPVQKYEYLSGRVAPQRLLEATLRAEQLGIASASQTGGEENAAPEKREQAPSALPRQKNHTGDTFLDDFCDMHNQNNPDHEANWVFVTGTGSIHWTTLDWVQSAARARVGTVRFRARVKTCLLCQWGSYSTVNLSNGQGWVFTFGQGNNFQWNAIVDQADGDTYDFCSFGND